MGGRRGHETAKVDISYRHRQHRDSPTPPRSEKCHHEARTMPAEWPFHRDITWPAVEGYGRVANIMLTRRAAITALILDDSRHGRRGVLSR